jgi:hypothetical protein
LCPHPFITLPFSPPTISARIFSRCAQAHPRNLAGGAGDEERTKDRRQTCTKLGSDVLGAQMETHRSRFYFFFTSLVFFYFASFLYSLKSFFIFYS